MKTLCALIGAFFLLAGITVLVADLARSAAPRAGAGSSVSASPRSVPTPLVREGHTARPGHGARVALGSVSRRR
ncbi:MAG TPA: hypothetical protein VFL12_08865 [Thermoanaerobaculia bacterium]|nr:hypothetical protein [Thermoanaerobaculia bacterium]